ncbi:hypothetical protein Tco_0367773 [Tanacetum coccineum]
MDFNEPLVALFPSWKNVMMKVDFTFDEITFTTNNEVALLYPSHPNQEYFKDVSDFISKCCLNEAFIRAPTQYKEYLSEFWYTAKTLKGSKVWVSTPTGRVRGEIGGKIGGLDQISNKDATILYCLANGVQVDYEKIIWEDLIHKLNKKTREKIVPCPRFLSLLLEHMMPEYENEELTINHTRVFSIHNLTLKLNQPEEPPFTDHMKPIYNLDVPADSKAPKPSSQTEESSSDEDKSPSHPSPPILVVGEMHKEAHQAVGGPTSLGATSEERAHPQLSSDKTKSAGDGLKTAHTDSGVNKESKADDISLKVKLQDLSDILKDIKFAFFTFDSPPNEPIIVSDKSEEEEEVAKDKDTEATSHDVPKDTSIPPPPSIKSTLIQELMAQLTKLLVTSLKPKLSNLLASRDFTSCFPTKLKKFPINIIRLSGEIKELKKHVRDMEIELPGDIKEISTKLQVSLVKENLKTLDSFPSLLHKVTDTLNRFAIMVENASEVTSMNVPSAGQATASPAEGEC